MFAWTISLSSFFFYLCHSLVSIASFSSYAAFAVVFFPSSVFTLVDFRTLLKLIGLIFLYFSYWICSISFISAVDSWIAWANSYEFLFCMSLPNAVPYLRNVESRSISYSILFSTYFSTSRRIIFSQYDSSTLVLSTTALFFIDGTFKEGDIRKLSLPFCDFKYFLIWSAIQAIGQAIVQAIA